MRKRRKIWGVRIALEVPVSSSRVRKQNPLADRGRWRTMTCPAVLTRRPSGTPFRSAEDKIPLSRSVGRRWAEDLRTRGEAAVPVVGERLFERQTSRAAATVLVGGQAREE